MSTMFRRKSLAHLQAEAAQASELKRVLGPTHLVLLGIGAIIGAGIFSLTGIAAATNAGPAIVFSFILAGIACTFAGLCYAEMASMIPICGSAYTYSYATMGELLAWIIGWDLILEYAVAAMTVAIAWSGYVVSFLADLGVVVPPQFTASPGTVIPLADGTSATALFNLPAVLIIVAVTALLVVGIQESATVNAAIVAIKVAVVLIFIIAGWSFIDGANHQPFIPPNEGTFGVFGWSGVLRGAGLVFFAYIGFDAVSTAAQEARNPQRDMPIGILGSLAICTVLYILVAYVLTGLVSYTDLNVPAPIAVGIERTGIGWLQPLVKIGAIMGLSSVILVMLLGQPRIFYTMAKDGLFPQFAAKVHPKYRTPHITIMATGVFVALGAALIPLRIVGELVSIGTLFAFMLVSIAVWVLRRTDPDAPRPFRVPAMPVIVTLSVLSCFGLMLGLPVDTWLRLAVWLGIGMAIYFLYGRHHSKIGRESAVAEIARTSPPSGLGRS
ncbi:MAG: amino acid permease [Gemmatimonadota bacterium]